MLSSLLATKRQGEEPATVCDPASMLTHVGIRFNLSKKWEFGGKRLYDKRGSRRKKSDHNTWDGEIDEYINVHRRSAGANDVGMECRRGVASSNRVCKGREARGGVLREAWGGAFKKRE